MLRMHVLPSVKQGMELNHRQYIKTCHYPPNRFVAHAIYMSANFFKKR